VGSCYGMAMNVTNAMVVRISGKPSPVQNMIELKQLDSVEYSKYLGSLLTNDASCTHMELNSGLSWQKQHLTRRRLLLPANWT
jgi:hypothetical protein